MTGYFRLRSAYVPTYLEPRTTHYYPTENSSKSIMTVSTIPMIDRSPSPSSPSPFSHFPSLRPSIPNIHPPTHHSHSHGRKTHHSNRITTSRKQRRTPIRAITHLNQRPSNRNSRKSSNCNNAITSSIIPSIFFRFAQHANAYRRQTDIRPAGESEDDAECDCEGEDCVGVSSGGGAGGAGGGEDCGGEPETE